MDKYTDVDMLKGLVKTLEMLTEENKELRNEIKMLKGELTYSMKLSEEARQKLTEVFGNSDDV